MISFQWFWRAEIGLQGGSAGSESKWGNVVAESHGRGGTYAGGVTLPRQTRCLDWLRSTHNNTGQNGGRRDLFYTRRALQGGNPQRHGSLQAARTKCNSLTASGVAVLVYHPIYFGMLDLLKAPSNIPKVPSILQECFNIFAVTFHGFRLL